MAECEAAFDMEKACVAEAGLLDEPVRALVARLRQLLEDWPEHPILTQLLNLCDRLTGDAPARTYFLSYHEHRVLLALTEVMYIALGDRNTLILMLCNCLLAVLL